MRVETRRPSGIAWPRPKPPKVKKPCSDDLEVVKTASAAAASAKKASRPAKARPPQPTHNNKLLGLIGNIHLDQSLNRVVAVQEGTDDEHSDDSDKPSEAESERYE